MTYAELHGMMVKIAKEGNAAQQTAPITTASTSLGGSATYAATP